jgi:acylphosphatase
MTSSANADLTRRYVVSGRVQGVGFRYFTQRKAVELNLRGWVRNRPDGTVEAEACGPQDQLETFERALRSGPPLGRVDHLAVAPAPPTTETGFRIKS